MCGATLSSEGNVRVYISGPMRGKPKHNFPAFDQAASRLVAAGHVPINPADLDRQSGDTGDPNTLEFLRYALRRDFAALFECDGVALLPGWRQSAGATCEVSLSCTLGLRFMDAITLHDSTWEIQEWFSSIRQVRTGR